VAIDAIYQGWALLITDYVIDIDIIIEQMNPTIGLTIIVSEPGSFFSDAQLCDLKTNNQRG